MEQETFCDLLLLRKTMDTLPECPIIISYFRLIIQLFDLHVQKKALHQRLKII